MNQSFKVAGLSLACAVALHAAGYKLPQQSLNSTALGAASVAFTNGADATYYNPANMVWMDNAYFVEGGLTYVNLPKIKFEGTIAAHSGESEVENIFKPSLHVVTKEYYENWRFGFSMTAPGGLSKRWDTPYAKTFSEEFTLKVIEANPTAAYKINDQLAIGFGLRMVYSDGVVKSDGRDFGLLNAARDLTGDSIDYGYNVALAYRPTPELRLAATYRSKVDLTVEGKAKLYAGALKVYDGGASVSIPLPATLSLASAYTFDKTTVEFVFERTYWSAYKTLDFDYSNPIPPALVPSFDAPVAKNWKDSNTYRLGITHQYSDKLTLMAGYAYDETPVPESTLGFEQPDSDANIYSFGFTYKMREDITVGLAYLYSDKKERTVNHPENLRVNGKFTGSGAHLVTTGITYRF